MKEKKIEERFWSNVHKTETCWLWLGTINDNGYGCFSMSVNGKRFSKRAHRVSYELIVGPVQEGLDLDHLCRVRNCVNPNHLEPVTRKVNLRRGIGITAVRAKQDSCIHGHPLSGDNLIIKKNGCRQCRECSRIKDSKRPSGWERSRRARIKAASAG